MLSFDVIWTKSAHIHKPRLGEYMKHESIEKELDFGRDLKSKFELYFLGLVFTLLGLAIQTSKFGTNPISEIAELLGWVCLLVSPAELSLRPFKCDYP